MEGVIMRSSWLNESEENEELVRELFDDESPLFLLPSSNNNNSNQETRIESNIPQLSATTTNIHEEGEVETIKQVMSSVYSGPTIQDIENALSSTTKKDQTILQTLSFARINSLLERDLSKIENNKYTLKMKSNGSNGMPDDGYKWRKYGQKSIKNSPYPRSYYRCTNPRCNAKKQVERSSEDQDTFLITYEGLHLHFAYPYFFHNPPQKKPKSTTPEAHIQAHEAQNEACEAQESPKEPTAITNGPIATETGQQGLLEDVVPLAVRNPSSSPVNNHHENSNSWSSIDSSSWSPPTSPSSLSTWSPNHSITSWFDIISSQN